MGESCDHRGVVLNRLRIATRGSELALRQTEIVAKMLHAGTGCDIEFVVVTTRGDRNTDQPIAEIGGVGVFTRAVEDAVLADEADIAVHSLKDLPTAETPGLIVAAIPPRGAANDVLIIRSDILDPSRPPTNLPGGATVGTSSPRRTQQMLHLQPDARVAPIRGNVPTRVEKLRAGEFDAIILAAAGIERLAMDLDGLTVIDLLSLDFLPSPGQGAIAVQCKTDNARIRGIISNVHDESTAHAVAAERGLLAKLEGGCHAAFGCLGSVAESGSIRLRAVAFENGLRKTAEANGPNAGFVIEECYRQLRG